MNEPLRQAYDEQGRPISGKGYTKQESFTGVLHAAAQVWIWRRGESGIEILLQKRSLQKQAWPELYTSSAGGHIDLGEEPLDAAVREVREEIGIELAPEQLLYIGTQRLYMRAEDLIENEFLTVYLTELRGESDFVLQPEEVSAVEWISLAQFKRETIENPEKYLPWGPVYFSILHAALDRFIGR